MGWCATTLERNVNGLGIFDNKNPSKFLARTFLLIVLVFFTTVVVFEEMVKVYLKFFGCVKFVQRYIFTVWGCDP